MFRFLISKSPPLHDVIYFDLGQKMAPMGRVGGVRGGRFEIGIPKLKIRRRRLFFGGLPWGLSQFPPDCRQSGVIPKGFFTEAVPVHFAG